MLMQATFDAADQAIAAGFSKEEFLGLYVKNLDLSNPVSADILRDIKGYLFPGHV